MSEPTVQVPVSLIEDVKRIVVNYGYDRAFTIHGNCIDVHDLTAFAEHVAAEVHALLSQPTPTAEPVQDIGDRARAMIRWAEDYTGNAGLCYARCKEHDWRSRKRNVNNQYADPQNVRR